MNMLKRLEKIASDLERKGQLSLNNLQLIKEICRNPLEENSSVESVFTREVEVSLDQVRQDENADFIRKFNMGVYYPDFPDKEEFWPAMIVPKDQYDKHLKDKIADDEILLYFFEMKMLNIKANDPGWQKWDDDLEFFQTFVQKYWDFPDTKIKLAARFKETGELSRKYKWKAWLEMEEEKKLKTSPQSTPEKKKRKERVYEKCQLCPSRKGPFLYTDEGKLVHRLCAELIPETKIRQLRDDEYVTGVENVHQEWWEFTCSVCRKKGPKNGACIQCEKCTNSVHATCADKVDLLLEEEGKLRFYCTKHNIVKQDEKTRKKEKQLMDLGKTFIKGTFVTCHWTDGQNYQAKVVSQDLENKTCTLHFNGQPKDVLYHNVPWSKMYHLKSPPDFVLSESDDWTDDSGDDSSVQSVHYQTDEDKISRNRYALRKGDSSRSKKDVISESIGKREKPRRRNQVKGNPSEESSAKPRRGISVMRVLSEGSSEDEDQGISEDEAERRKETPHRRYPLMRVASESDPGEISEEVLALSEAESENEEISESAAGESTKDQDELEDNESLDLDRKVEQMLREYNAVSDSNSDVFAEEGRVEESDLEPLRKKIRIID